VIKLARPSPERGAADEAFETVSEIIGDTASLVYDGFVRRMSQTATR
jgi:hypothetical protein